MAQQSSTTIMSPILSAVHKDTVVFVTSVVVFVAACKLYNIFMATPSESFSDVEISKVALIGIMSVVLTRVSIGALFEQSVDIRGLIGLSPRVSSVSVIPQMTRLVRNPKIM